MSELFQYSVLGCAQAELHLRRGRGRDAIIDWEEMTKMYPIDMIQREPYAYDGQNLELGHQLGHRKVPAG